jgi:hypothetical protein
MGVRIEGGRRRSWASSVIVGGNIIEIRIVVRVDVCQEEGWR